MKKPDFYYASDYAGLSFDGGHFYYGYEHSVCAECGNKNNGEYCETHEDADRYWCFVANFNDIEIVMPHNKLGTKNMFDVVSNLNVGIGWILSRYDLKLKT